MNADVKRLLDAATPLPWAGWTNGFDAGIVSESDGAPADYRYRSLVFGGEPHEGWIDPGGDDVALVVHAVNHLPDYEAVAEVFERWCEGAFMQDGHLAVCSVRYGYTPEGCPVCGNDVKGREALRRLRGDA